jgi:hypothetical protein
MIEDELRSLLTERAGGLPDNPARAVEVHSRIAGIRRRRIAGAALGLVLLALAGLAVLRLPGANDSLPPGVPAPPYFDDTGRTIVPGYSTELVPMELAGRPSDRLVPDMPGDFRYLVVMRCARPGELTFRNLVNDQSIEVDCSHPVGDHFEGAAAIDAAASRTLLAEGPGASNVRFEPGAPGQLVTLLKSHDPDRLSRWSDPGSRPLAEGTRTRAGTTVPITVPPARRGVGVSMTLTVECVAGVRLDLSVPTGALGTADCDPTRGAPNLPDMLDGRVQIILAPPNLARLGLRPGQRVLLTIRSAGRDTDQWRVYPIGP